jgi:hypothetical protein
MGNSVRFKASLDDQVTGKLGRIRDQFDRLGKSKGAASILQGVGMGVGIGVWNLLGSAVGGVTDQLAKGVRGAIDEEVGIARLTAALKANIPAWDGATDAIERAIKPRMRLGFADDELRDSLAAIVPATRDVAQALDVQRVAMDLARFKGISLADASQALVKVEAGQYRMLKSLGIELRAGATATEALAAVQKVATGQADAYADTVGGKMLTAQTRFDEVMENLGSKVLPLVTGALEVGSGALDFFELALGGAARQGDAVAITIQNNTDAALVGAAAWGTYYESTMELAGALPKVTRAEEDSIIAFRAAERASGEAAKELGQLSDASDETSRHIARDNKEIRKSYQDTVDFLLGRYTDSFDTAMGITEARADLHNARSDADRAEAYEDLAALGALSVKDYDKWLATLERLAKGTKGKVHESYLAAIRDVNALKNAATGQIKIDVIYKNSQTKIGGKAEGGPVAARRPYIVGEEGPELFVPKTAGTIIPNDQLEMSHTGSGYVIPNGSSRAPAGAVTVNVNLTGAGAILTPRQGQEIAKAIAPELERQLARAR